MVRILANQRSTKDVLKKEQEMIQRYLDKINDLKAKQKERDDAFAQKVGYYVLKSFHQDLDSIEEFKLYVEDYLAANEKEKEQTESLTGVDSFSNPNYGA